MRRSPNELFKQTKQLAPFVPLLLDAINELMKMDDAGKWSLQLAKDILELTGYANMSVAAAEAKIPPSRIQNWLMRLDTEDMQDTFWHILCSYPSMLEKALGTTTQGHWLQLDKLFVQTLLSGTGIQDPFYDLAGIYSSFLGGHYERGLMLLSYVKQARESQDAALARQKKDEQKIVELTNFISALRDKADKLLAPSQAIEPGPHDKMRIEDLDLSIRTYNCLRKANLLRVGDIKNLRPEEFLAIRNFGMKSLREVNEKLLTLGIQIPWPLGVDDEENE
jgi:hypothetical protein